MLLLSICGGCKRYLAFSSGHKHVLLMLAIVRCIYLINVCCGGWWPAIATAVTAGRLSRGRYRGNLVTDLSSRTSTAIAPLHHKSMGVYYALAGYPPRAGIQLDVYLTLSERFVG